MRFCKSVKPFACCITIFGAGIFQHCENPRDPFFSVLLILVIASLVLNIRNEAFSKTTKADDKDSPESGVSSQYDVKVSGEAVVGSHSWSQFTASQVSDRMGPKEKERSVDFHYL